MPRSDISSHDKKLSPITKKYLIICVVLVILTLIEYFVFKIETIRDNPVIMYPFLGALSLVKLVLVVGSYMHLESEPRLLKFLFFGTAILTVVIFTILMLSSPLT
ncbi:MAG: cytochrome C oxidase subunit IV family protein [Proteobacteria bacterium]|nr:cytochrome C oxidase subunit IV family protein [Pseudomonadota bacterium]